MEQANPDSVSDFITLRDGHCRNHGRLPARDPIYRGCTDVLALNLLATVIAQRLVAYIGTLVTFVVTFRISA